MQDAGCSPSDNRSDASRQGKRRLELQEEVRAHMLREQEEQMKAQQAAQQAAVPQVQQ